MQVFLPNSSIFLYFETKIPALGIGSGLPLPAERYLTKKETAHDGRAPPLAWIQNYITTRAKRMMDENPRVTVKEMAFALGFPNTANFCRYFKTATNMTPQQYKDKSAQH